MDGGGMIKREDGPFRWNLNTVTVLGGATFTVVTQIIIATVLWTNQTRDVKDLQNQVTAIQQDSKELKTQIATIAPLTYRVDSMVASDAENKETLKQMSARIDRVVEQFGDKLDTIGEGMNKLSTQVSVLSSKLDDMQGKADKTLFRTPIVRP